MFYPPSSRHLEIEQAAEIRRVLPAFVHAVAVVVNPEREYINQIVADVGVDLIQFHGEEDNDFCASFGLPFVKVIRVMDDAELEKVESQYPDACGILLDTHVKDVYGGSGVSFDWKRASYGGSKPVILAGGLTPENVGEAIHVARPYAVDVSSGVETSGTKDSAKIQRFCHSVMSKDFGQ